MEAFGRDAANLSGEQRLFGGQELPEGVCTLWISLDFPAARAVFALSQQPLWLHHSKAFCYRHPHPSSEHRAVKHHPPAQHLTLVLGREFSTHIIFVTKNCGVFTSLFFFFLFFFIQE